MLVEWVWKRSWSLGSYIARSALTCNTEKTLQNNLHVSLSLSHHQSDGKLSATCSHCLGKDANPLHWQQSSYAVQKIQRAILLLPVGNATEQRSAFTQKYFLGLSGEVQYMFKIQVPKANKMIRGSWPRFSVLSMMCCVMPNHAQEEH